MKSGTNKLMALLVPLVLAFVLAACGGTTPAADSSAATPATNAQAAPTPSAPQPIASGQAQQATAQGEPSAPAATTQPETAATSAGGATSTTAKLNLNETTADQLLNTIPDLGDRMVREFFEYRPYISIQQFRREIGKYVSADQVAAYEQYVYVPIDVNQADAATLQQLPGVDATLAAELIAGRPYASNQAFLDKLGGRVSGADLQQAAAYLSAN